MMETRRTEDRDASDGPPPFLGSWHRVYAAVLFYLLLLIAALYLFTRMFTYSPGFIDDFHRGPAMTLERASRAPALGPKNKLL